MILQDTMQSVQEYSAFKVHSGNRVHSGKWMHPMDYAYTFLAFSPFIFLVLNLPVPIGRLTPAASSIFNMVSNVTLLSPWGAVCPCVCREGISVHHTTPSCFFFFFFFFLSLMFWSSLSLWALHTTKSLVTLPNSSPVLDRYTLNNLSSNWGKGVLYCTEKWKSHSIAVVV